MKLSLKNIFLFSLTFLFFTSCDTTKKATDNHTIEFTILQMNDVYEIAPLEGGRVGGIARVATINKALRKENPNTISILAGDFLSPSLLGRLKDNGKKIAGMQMVQALNSMGLDYATFGNHEFDLKSYELLQDRIDSSDFEYICNNAFHNDNGSASPFTQKGKPVAATKVITFSNKYGDQVRVGLTGTVIPFNKAGYVSYTDPFETTEKSYQALKSQSDILIGITHLFIDDDKKMAKQFPGFDLLIGGHDHTNMHFKIGNTVITKADANAKTVYIHRVSYNPTTKKTTIKSELRPVTNIIEAEPHTQAIVNTWVNKQDEILRATGYDPDQMVMATKVPLVCTEAIIRNEQTNFGHITLEAFEAAMPGADLYVLNSGSMRLDDNISGTVTQYDILRTYPYGGPIVKIDLPGAVLSKVLTIGAVTNKGEGGYLQVNYVSGTPDHWKIRKQAINPKKTYSVVMPKFLASGKEANLEVIGNYLTKKAIPKSFTIGSRTVKNDIRDMVIDFMVSSN